VAVGVVARLLWLNALMLELLSVFMIVNVQDFLICNQEAKAFVFVLCLVNFPNHYERAYKDSVVSSLK